MINMVYGKFVVGPKDMVEGLTREEIADEEGLKALGVAVKEWWFEARDVELAARRALRNQRGYNASELDGKAMRYVHVRDKEGHWRDLFDAE